MFTVTYSDPLFLSVQLPPPPSMPRKRKERKEISTVPTYSALVEVVEKGCLLVIAM